MTNSQSNRMPKPLSPRAAWAGWLIAAMAWALHLSLSYGLVEWYCHNQQALMETSVTVVLHAITALCAGLAGWGAWLAYRNYKKLPHTQRETKYERSRFMAAAGAMLSLSLLLLILVEGAPNFVLEPCL